MLKRLIEGSVVTGLALAATLILEYAFLVYTANRLTPDEFGVLSSALAVLTLALTAACTGLGTATTQAVAGTPASFSRSEHASSAFVVQWISAAAMAALLLVGAWAASRSAELADISASLCVGALLIPSAGMASLASATRLGLGKVSLVALGRVAGGAVRLLVVVLALTLADGPEVVLTGYIVAFIAETALHFPGVRHLWRRRSVQRKAMKRIVRVALPTTLFVSLVALFVRADVLLLKALLTEDVNSTVASYNASAALARAIFYAYSAIAVPLLPLIAAAERVDVRAVKQLVAALALGAVALSTAAGLFGPAVLALLFPVELLSLGHLLAPLTLAFGVLGVAYVLATVLIAADHPRVPAFAFLVGVAAYLVVASILIPGVETIAHTGLRVPALGADGAAAALLCGGVAALLVLILALRLLRPADGHPGVDSPTG